MTIEIAHCDLNEAIEGIGVRQRVVVSAIARDQNGLVLVGKRGPGVAEGQWSLIGGKPDPDEELGAALLREMREEVGVDLVQPTFWGYLDSPEGLWRSFFWEGLLSGVVRIDNKEVQEARFIDASSVMQLDWAFGHGDVLAHWFRHRRIEQE